MSQTEIDFLNLWARGIMPTFPADYYLAAHTGDPGEGGLANEVTAPDYQRMPIPRSQTAWSAPQPDGQGGHYITNTIEITWPVPTSNWGTITHLSLWKVPSGGTAADHVWSFAGTSAQTITAGGSALRVAPGELRWPVRFPG